MHIDGCACSTSSSIPLYTQQCLDRRKNFTTLPLTFGSAGLCQFGFGVGLYVALGSESLELSSVLRSVLNVCMGGLNLRLLVLGSCFPVLERYVLCLHRPLHSCFVP